MLFPSNNGLFVIGMINPLELCSEGFSNTSHRETSSQCLTQKGYGLKLGFKNLCTLVHKDWALGRQKKLVVEANEENSHWTYGKATWMARDVTNSVQKNIPKSEETCSN
jgi:hypothetical protein